jgi:hypothetical protein
MNYKEIAIFIGIGVAAVIIGHVLNQKLIDPLLNGSLFGLRKKTP